MVSPSNNNNYYFSLSMNLQTEQKQPGGNSLPGEGAVFTVKENSDWSNLFSSGGPLVRTLSLLSSTPNSLIKKMEILGYRDGSIAISVNFDQKDIEIIRNYLKKNELDISQDFQGSYLSTKSEEVKKLFTILAEKNKIPDDKLQLITALVESCNWNSVTPLKGDQILPPLDLYLPEFGPM